MFNRYDLYDYTEYDAKREELDNASNRDAMKRLECIEESFQDLLDVLYRQTTEISQIDVDNIVSEMYDMLADQIVMSKKMPNVLPTIVRKV